MSASIRIAATADLPAIARAAGCADRFGFRYSEGVFFVDGVTQAALDAAVVSVGTAPPAAPVPASVTNFQARALMRRTILPDGRSLETAVREALAAAKAAAAALPEADAARIAADEAWLAWEQSNDFMRNGALVSAIGAQMGFSAAALDQMFRDAAQIEA